MKNDKASERFVATGKGTTIRFPEKEKKSAVKRKVKTTKTKKK